MNSELARALGFFAVTFMPVAYQHMRRSTLPSELLDALLTTLAFTLAFALGAYLAGARMARAARPVSVELGLGAGAAIVLWAILSAAWQSAPRETARLLEPWAFPLNLTAMLVSGAVTTCTNARLPAGGGRR